MSSLNFIFTIQRKSKRAKNWSDWASYESSDPDYTMEEILESLEQDISWLLESGDEVSLTLDYESMGFFLSNVVSNETGNIGNVRIRRNKDGEAKLVFPCGDTETIDVDSLIESLQSL